MRKMLLPFPLHQGPLPNLDEVPVMQRRDDEAVPRPAEWHRAAYAGREGKNGGSLERGG